MALKAIISQDEHAKLPDALKGEYVAGKDGRYTLQVSAVDGYALEDVSALTRALSTERENASSYAAKLEKLKDLDPDAARDALQKIAKMKDWTPEEKVREQMKAREEALRTEFEKALDPVKKEKDRYWSEVQNLLVRSEAMRALAGKAEPELLLPIIEKRARVVERDGKFVAQVMDDNGAPMMHATKDAQGRTVVVDMPLEQFALSLKDNPRYAPAFFGTGHSGSGAQGSGGGKGGGSQFRMTDAEARNDPRKYQALRAEAAKAGQSVQIVES